MVCGPRGGARQSPPGASAGWSEEPSGGSVPSPATKGRFLPLYPFAAPRPCQGPAGETFPPQLLGGPPTAGPRQRWWCSPLRMPISPLRRQLISLTAGGTG